MNALTKIENTALSAMSEQELVEVLQSSLYPGAALASIKMVLGYCKASGLDPMRKPVHIVPMWDSKAKQMRDVTMPGIGLYRTDASRTGEHVGTDEPIFGPMVEYDLGGAQVTVPEWCKVTVYRLKNGMKCAYTATEYWIENYATAGKDTTAPNAMWKKRGRGQLAKCAEAQALRKGFPEVGNQPTAEEMEGKSLDEGRSETAAPTVKHMGAAEVVQQSQPTADDSRPAFPAADFDKGLPVWKKAAGKLPVSEVLARAEAANPDFAFTEQQRAVILSLKKDAPTDAQPKVTYASVDEQMRAARTPDQLDSAASLIATITDAQQAAELKATYEELRNAITDSDRP
jgi:phage recombination protein Bet